MRKRENDGEIIDFPKKRKPNEGEPSGIAAAVNARNQVQAPPIFKLNAICCDDLFEWLSLKELHSLGQTCKRMHRLTGVYFRDNFKHTTFAYHDLNLYYNGNIRLTGFVEFVQSIQFSQIQWGNNLQCIGANFDSLRRVSFLRGPRAIDVLVAIEKALNQIEAVHFSAVDEIELCNGLLEQCPNLKTLHIEQSSLDVWKGQQYPKLECFILIQPKNFGPFNVDFSDNLATFLQLHSHLQQFETDYECLLNSRHTIIDSKVKLDVLTIHYGVVNRANFDDTFTLLNGLYDKGFYKRLKLKFSQHKSSPILQAQINQIATLRGLEMFCGYFEDNIVPPMIVSIKELGIFNDRFHSIDLEAITISFPNLRQILLDTSSTDQCFPFIRRLAKLKEVDICRFVATNGSHDLSTLNEERKKLPGACKVTIYVPDNDYFETKFAPSNLYANHDLIEIKRIASSNIGNIKTCT